MFEYKSLFWQIQRKFPNPVSASEVWENELPSPDKYCIGGALLMSLADDPAHGFEETFPGPTRLTQFLAKYYYEQVGEVMPGNKYNSLYTLVQSMQMANDYRDRFIAEDRLERVLKFLEQAIMERKLEQEEERMMNT